MITIQLRNGPMIGHRTFQFPDGQLHVELARGIVFSHVNIQASIRTPSDLFELALIKDVLDNQIGNDVALDLRYLMGGRMDKRTSKNEPLTLDIVAGMIKAMGKWASIKVFDPHSRITTELLDAETYYPDKELEQLLFSRPPQNSTILVSPDKGAARKLSTRLEGAGHKLGFGRVEFEKKRDPHNGKIIDMIGPPSLALSVNKKQCIIIDDICDGGRTFVECSKHLRSAGATNVALFVTHGLFTKGLPLEGINHVYTTNSTAIPFYQTHTKENLTVLGG